MNNILDLKSGSDIRGVASGKNPFDIELTDGIVASATAAFTEMIAGGKKSEGLKIAVGMDPRLSSERIAGDVIMTLLSLGVKVYDCELASTPSMFMTTINLDCDAAVMVTASHLPANMNGLKFFTKDGGLSGADIEHILLRAAEHPFTPKSVQAKAEKSAHMDIYAKSLRDMIIKGVGGSQQPLEGLKIAVDAGNGVGGFYAEKVLSPLGADCSGSRYLEPDGHFANHNPNPEDKTAMDSIRDAVLESQSDLGIIFDTDVDRAACVDADGNEINRNRLVALASAIALKSAPGGTIVTDSVTSDGLAEFITKKLGGVHRRFKRGYKNVIDEARRLQDDGEQAPLAIETSGHAAFIENYYLDDGAYLMTKIVIETARMKKKGKELKSLIAGLSEPLEEKEIRYKILRDDFKSYGKYVIAKFEEYAEKSEGVSICPENYEGVRVSFDTERGDGWMLLRMSLHEPLLVMNCESVTEGGVDKILLWFEPFLAGFGKTVKNN